MRNICVFCKKPVKKMECWSVEFKEVGLVIALIPTKGTAHRSCANKNIGILLKGNIHKD